MLRINFYCFELGPVKAIPLVKKKASTPCGVLALYYLTDDFIIRSADSLP
jgi:hypothetical protein